jgi:hypothetical protein
MMINPDYGLAGIDFPALTLSVPLSFLNERVLSAGFTLVSARPAVSVATPSVIVVVAEESESEASLLLPLQATKNIPERANAKKVLLFFIRLYLS